MNPKQRTENKFTNSYPISYTKYKQHKRLQSVASFHLNIVLACFSIYMMALPCIHSKNLYFALHPIENNERWQPPKIRPRLISLSVGFVQNATSAWEKKITFRYRSLGFQVFGRFLNIFQTSALPVSIRFFCVCFSIRFALQLVLFFGSIVWCWCSRTRRYRIGGPRQRRAALTVSFWPKVKYTKRHYAKVIRLAFGGPYIVG